MARAVWKGPFIDETLLKKVLKVEKESTRKRLPKITTWSRRSVILPQFLEKTVHVYNGSKMIPLVISEEMVGYKFGEFIPTRTRAVFKKKDKKKK
jgi:small subunit ribosomal protein S19